MIEYMTLDKHRLDGLPPFNTKVMSATQFEGLLLQVGYIKTSAMPAQGGRRMVSWIHLQHRKVAAIYSQDMKTVVTAYHL